MVSLLPFYSISLSKCEQAHSSVEKEATAIVEAVRKWSHLLTGKRFRIVTDQRSVSFMYDNKNCEKIKNAKILRWRIELSQYQYEIVYRAGKLNATEIRCLVLIVPVYHFLLFMRFMLVYVALEFC